MTEKAPLIKSKEIIKRVAEKTGVPYAEAHDVFYTIFEEIGEALTRGERVIVRNFGRWQITHRKEYSNRIYGGRAYLIPETDTVRFRTSAAFRERMKQTEHERRMARGR